MDWDNIPAPLYERMERLGSIFAWDFNSCDAPFSAYVAAAPSAAVKPLIMLLSFGLDDVVRGLLRPSGLYRHRPMGRAAAALSRAFPEFGEAIGKAVGDRMAWVAPLREAGAGRVASQLWKLDGAIQQGIFYLLLLDVLSQFGNGLIKGVKKQGYCDSSRFRRAGDYDGFGTIMTNGFYTMSLPIQTYDHGFDRDGTSFEVRGILPDTAFCRMTVQLDLINISDHQSAEFILNSAIFKPDFTAHRIAEKRGIVGPGEAVRIVLTITGRGHYFIWGFGFDAHPREGPEPISPPMALLHIPQVQIIEFGTGTLP